MWQRHRVFRHLFAGLVLTFVGMGVALAAATAPVIKRVSIAYSTSGAPVPVSINILGSDLCAGSPCAAPTVTLGGKSVSLAAFSAKSITADLPQPLALGDYTLTVVTANGSAVFDVTLSKLTLNGAIVIDSNGKVVGPYLYDHNAGPSVAVNISDVTYIVPLAIQSLPTPGTVSAPLLTFGSGVPGTCPACAILNYTTSNCSGTPYSGFLMVASETETSYVGYALSDGTNLEPVPWVSQSDTPPTFSSYYNPNNTVDRLSVPLCQANGIGGVVALPLTNFVSISSLGIVPPLTITNR